MTSAQGRAVMAMGGSGGSGEILEKEHMGHRTDGLEGCREESNCLQCVRRGTGLGTQRVCSMGGPAP